MKGQIAEGTGKGKTRRKYAQKKRGFTLVGEPVGEGGLYSFLDSPVFRLPWWKLRAVWSGSSGRPAKLLGMVL